MCTNVSGIAFFCFAPALFVLFPLLFIRLEIPVYWNMVRNEGNEGNQETVELSIGGTYDGTDRKRFSA